MHVFTSLFLPLLLLISYYASFAVSNVLFGFKTKDAAYLSTGSAISHGVTMKSDFNWVRKLDRCLVGMSGDVPDCEELFAILERECSIRGLDYGRSLSSKVLASLCRHTLLYKGLSASILVAGFEDSHGEECEGTPKLFWIDPTGAMQDVSYAAHGKETSFLLSMLDQNRHLLLHDEATIPQGTLAGSEKPPEASTPTGRPHRGHRIASRVARQCWSQLRKRSAGRIDTSASRLFCVDIDGVQEVNVGFSSP